MIKLKTHVFILLAIVSIQTANAQEAKTPYYSKFSIKIAVGDHAVGLPFQNYFKQILRLCIRLFI